MRLIRSSMHIPGLRAAAVETLAATAVALFLSVRFTSPLVWLFLPLGLLVFLGRPLSEHGLDLRLRPPSIALRAALGASLLALYAALHALVAQAFLHQSFVLHVPRHPILDLVREFLIVGFPEEVFFRGALMPAIGIWASSGVFALLHIGRDRRYLPWTVSAFAVGVVMGLLARWLGDLGACITAHFTINFLNLRHITRNELL